MVKKGAKDSLNSIRLSHAFLTLALDGKKIHEPLFTALVACELIEASLATVENEHAKRVITERVKMAFDKNG